MMEDQLLLVTHVPLKSVGGALSIDDQTAEGLMRWSENFGRVAYAGIAVPEASLSLPSTTNWVPIADLPCASRLDVFAMPNAYRLQTFFSEYRAGRARLAGKIAGSRYLCFTLGALAGDWAAVASLEAIRQERKYAVWFDRVEHEVIRSDLPTMPFKRRLKETTLLPVMQHYHRYLIRQSHVGLFQGMDCYDHYSQFTDVGHCVYDTHTKPSDFIDKNSLNKKIESALSGEPLRICYVGRAADMKGPFDWLNVMEMLRDSDLPFKARWLGDGPLLQQMRAIVESKNLSAHVELAGFVSDRQMTLDTLKESHLFVFCHKTPESPRCLIESLVCGAPIVGYTSAYARGLVEPKGGGGFVDVGDIKGLSDRIVALHRNRPSLAQTIVAAAQSGLRFDEERLYRERAGLIRTQLGS